MKKKSSYAKGNEYEREVVKILKAKDWSVFRQHRKPVYIEGRMLMLGSDIFGCDIVAKKKDCKPRWIQVSTEDNKHKKIQQVLEFPWSYDLEDLEIWCRIKKKKAYLVYRGPNFKDTQMEVVPHA